MTLYSLEKLIEWKPYQRWLKSPHQGSLYSLEKLIEWKLDSADLDLNCSNTLYSLEKLIEWKLPRLKFHTQPITQLSTR